MQQMKTRYPFELAPFYGLMFAYQAVYMANINNYLLSVGLQAHTVARVASILPIVGAGGLFIFGRLGDRVRSKNILLIALIILSAAMVLLLGRGSAVMGAGGDIAPLVVFITIVLCAHAFVYMPTDPLLSTITLEALDRTKSSFGPIRAVGTVSFALTAAVIGFLIDDQWGRIIWMSAAALILCAASGLLLPKVAGHAREKKERIPLTVLLKNKSLMVMICLSFFLMLSASLFFSVFSMHLASGAIVGGALVGSRLVNIASTVGAVAEVPFLIYADRIYKRIGVGAILLIAALAISVRMTLIYFISNPYQILATQILHGWGFIAIAFAMAKYINLVVPPQLKSAGQMLNAIIAVTCSRAIGSFTASYITEYMGMRENFLAGAAVAFISFIVFGIIIWKNPEMRTAGRE